MCQIFGGGTKSGQLGATPVTSLTLYCIIDFFMSDESSFVIFCLLHKYRKPPQLSDLQPFVLAFQI